jgi:endonuclease YncB( thermonuclease family)
VECTEPGGKPFCFLVRRGFCCNQTKTLPWLPVGTKQSKQCGGFIWFPLSDVVDAQSKTRARRENPVISRLACAITFLASIATAAPIAPGQIEVLDGDTIRAAGETFRLVGFDAPETYRAKCPSERELGNRATFRLRQLVAVGGLDLDRVACACRTGTEGTPRCNYGRSCGVLTARGKDVGAILIAEGSFGQKGF